MTDLELLQCFMRVTNSGDWRRLAHLGPSVWWSLVLVAIFSLGLSMLLYFSVIQAVEVMRARSFRLPAASVRRVVLGNSSG